MSRDGSRVRINRLWGLLWETKPRTRVWVLVYEELETFKEPRGGGQITKKQAKRRGVQGGKRCRASEPPYPRRKGVTVGEEDSAARTSPRKNFGELGYKVGGSGL